MADRKPLVFVNGQLTELSAADSVAGVPRYDVSQMLTALQRQVCENIGVGDPDHSFVADYILAKS